MKPKLIIFSIIILVICIILLMIIFIDEEEIPIWKRHVKHESGDRTDFYNDDLNVRIIMVKDSYGNLRLDGTGLNIHNESFSTGTYFSPEELYDTILTYYSDDLSSIQLKWFEYMLHHIVK